MNLILALADLLIVAVALKLAVLLRFSEDPVPARYQSQHQLTVTLAMMAVNLLVYYVVGLYRKVWRYAGVHELATISAAVSASYAPLLLTSVVTGGAGYSRGITVIAWVLTLLMVGGLRFALRLASEPMMPPHLSGATRVLILGSNDCGEATLRELRRNASRQHEVVGFLADSPSQVGLRIRGTEVLGTFDEVARLVAEQRIDQLVLAEPTPRLVRDTMQRCTGLRVELKVVPNLQSIVEGKSTAQLIREVGIEDLLERPAVRHDLSHVGSILDGKRVLVTGAGGSIGSEICRQVARLSPTSLILLGRGENSIHEIAIELRQHSALEIISVIADVRDGARMARVFAAHQPHVVFHAAAHKHVPFMEDHPEEAIAVNVLGTHNVIEAARAHGAERLVLLSTDKAVRPSSVMGASKRLAEQLILNASATEQSRRDATAPATRCTAVRFGNVLGSRGSVIPTFRRQIMLGGPVTVTHQDMTRFFMTIPEAVTLVLEAACLAEGGELFVLDMGEPVRIMDLARNLIRLSGYDPDVDIPIVVTGVRPGEKLDEVLLSEDESAQPTALPKVRRIETRVPHPRLASPSGMREALATLAKLTAQGDSAALRALIAELYPSNEGALR